MVKVTLSKPLDVNGAPVSELTFREAQLGDLIAGEAVGKGGQVAQIAATLASMCDVPYPAFKKLSARDFAKVNEAAAPLMGNETAPEAGAS